jgi:hypothetical protein
MQRGDGDVLIDFRSGRDSAIDYCIENNVGW